MISKTIKRSESARETELVKYAQNGDQDAFAKLVMKYHERIFNTIYAFVGDLDDADDLSQEVFVRAYLSLPDFEGRAQFYTWLYRIAVNCAKDWMKSPRREKYVFVERDYLESFEMSIDQTPPQRTDAQVVNRELQSFLENALNTLPGDMRRALVLREIDGFDYVEIAEIMGCSVGTVKSRLFRARKKLKRVWTAEYKENWEGTL